MLCYCSHCNEVHLPTTEPIPCVVLMLASWTCCRYACCSEHFCQSFLGRADPSCRAHMASGSCCAVDPFVMSNTLPLIVLNQHAIRVSLFGVVPIFQVMLTGTCWLLGCVAHVVVIGVSPSSCSVPLCKSWQHIQETPSCPGPAVMFCCACLARPSW